MPNSNVLQSEFFGSLLGSAIAKMAGGARMFGSDELRVREQQSIAAVRRAVEAANIELCGEDLGGSKGRRVTLDALTGELLIEIPGEDSVTL